MSDFYIGLSGLNVAQKALEITGNNIANASTEGYHRQELRIVPSQTGPGGTLAAGTGASVAEVRRVMDLLLERQILYQQPARGQVSQELSMLQTIEHTLAGLGENSLGDTISRFFGSLSELSSQPESPALREKVVWTADEVASQFQHLAGALTNLDEEAVLMASNLMAKVNDLAERIAQYNGQIQGLDGRDSAQHNLYDLRDQAIIELAELVDVEVNPGENNAVIVQVWGTPLVTNTHTNDLEVAYFDSETIGVTVKDVDCVDTTVRGGRIGALVALKNETINQLRSDVDTLATQIIQRVNNLHVQGIGAGGSFNQLTGWGVGTDPVADWHAPVTAGTVYARVTDLATGQVTRHAVDVVLTDTVSDIAAKFTANVDHVTGSAPGNVLHLQADAGYVFDFLPETGPAPATSTLTGTATPTLAGVYEGDANAVYTCTVLGTGEVGVTAGLAVEVRDGTGTLVTTLSVGQGYAAGDRLDLTQGMHVSLGMGTLNDTESFTVQAIADSDTSGVLAAAGINPFFSGRSAITMAVSQRLCQDPDLVATGLSRDGTGNLNVRRLAAVGQERLAALGDDTPENYYRDVVSSIGQQVAVRQARSEGLEKAAQQLADQRDGLSGVDINEEAAKLLTFERMYQAVARYMTTLEATRRMLFEIF